MVNGSVESNPGRRITDTDKVVYQGRTVMPPARRYYIMLHKPRGYVCTNDDIHAPKKALDLIRFPGCPRLFSAGRLDKNSEGLILFSNDGDFVEQLTHPRHEVYKTYDVSTEYELTPQDHQRFIEGVWDAGEFLKAAAVIPLTPFRVRLILGEGKNREIRRMVQAFQNRTKRLKRIAVGCLSLGSLPCGEWRELTAQEIRLALMRPRDLDKKPGSMPPEANDATPVKPAPKRQYGRQKTFRTSSQTDSGRNHFKRPSKNFSRSGSQHKKNTF